MSAGVGPAAVVHRPEFKRYEIFCEAADIYVDVHLLIRFSIYAKSASLRSILRFHSFANCTKPRARNFRLVTLVKYEAL